MEKVIHDLEQCLDDSIAAVVPADTVQEVIALLKAQSEEISALRRLVEWAEECGFGLDNIYWEEYVTRDELDGMGYIDQLIYVAKKAGELK